MRLAADGDSCASPAVLTPLLVWGYNDSAGRPPTPLTYPLTTTHVLAGDEVMMLFPGFLGAPGGNGGAGFGWPYDLTPTGGPPLPASEVCSWFTPPYLMIISVIAGGPWPLEEGNYLWTGTGCQGQATIVASQGGGEFTAAPTSLTTACGTPASVAVTITDSGGPTTYLTIAIAWSADFVVAMWQEPKDRTPCPISYPDNFYTWSDDHTTITGYNLASRCTYEVLP
jgi:hypothetical protein